MNARKNWQVPPTKYPGLTHGGAPSLQCEPGTQQPGHEAGHSADLLKSVKRMIIYFSLQVTLQCEISAHLHCSFEIHTRLVTC
jgi:hypothetical protein